LGVRAKDDYRLLFSFLHRLLQNPKVLCPSWHIRF
jgi:hypothetical protein